MHKGFLTGISSFQRFQNSKIPRYNVSCLRAETLRGQGAILSGSKIFASVRENIFAKTTVGGNSGLQPCYLTRPDY
ncbi:MAG: hypothetical protein LBF81_03615 [Prevotellaceae bacterium]|jgi:hypothetical protein|nr:hypothetical protein [Prevotellaceae bacterium]